MTTTTNTITEEGIETFSSEDQIYDYLSIHGLNTRFGLDGKNFDIFIVKELMDNALDFIEKNAKEFFNGKNPFVNVIITQEAEATKIRVRNSNAGINKIFSKEQIDNIFNLNKYYSSKRYRHKINRGELGDALKAILCIPYAIVVNDESNKHQNWDYSLEINTSNDNRSIKIKIGNIDQIKRKEELYVNKKDEHFHNQEEINYYNHFTEIVVYLPKIAVNYNEIDKLLRRYAVSNTHINFKFKIPGRKSESYIATQK